MQRKANDSLQWYVANRLSKKRAAWWIRLGAILFVSLAGLVPVLGAAGLIDEQPTVVAVVAEGDPGSVDLRRVEQRLNGPAAPSQVPSSGSSAGHEVAAVGEREDGGEVRAAASITMPAGRVVPITLKLE